MKKRHIIYPALVLCLSVACGERGKVASPENVEIADDENLGYDESQGDTNMIKHDGTILPQTTVAPDTVQLPKAVITAITKEDGLDVGSISSKERIEKDGKVLYAVTFRAKDNEARGKVLTFSAEGQKVPNVN